MIARITSCLAYLIRNDGVEKLLSLSSIIQTPHKLSAPTSGAAAQRKDRFKDFIDLRNNTMHDGKLTGQKSKCSAYPAC